MPGHLLHTPTCRYADKSCWAVVDKVWFTDRHHRETPQRIEDGLADVGIVWTTEVKEAVDAGRDIEGVAIAAPFNKQDEVSYAIGQITDGRNQENGATFLGYLASDAAQDIYASYGFVPASAEELTLKPIPN
jgi:ABC-type molybdate transport system substrate-binding protein